VTKKRFSLLGTKRLRFIALVAGVLASTSIVSEAVLSNLTFHARVEGCWLIIDPLNLYSFHLDIQFESSLLEFDEIKFLSSYAQAGEPDRSMIASGLVQDVAGISSTSEPPEGPVDIFGVHFTPLHPELASLTSFTTDVSILASDNDFIVQKDTETSKFVTEWGTRPPHVIGTFEIPYFTFHCPDSSGRAVEICLLGLLIGASIIQKKRLGLRTWA